MMMHGLANPKFIHILETATLPVLSTSLASKPFLQIFMCPRNKCDVSYGRHFHSFRLSSYSGLKRRRSTKCL